MNIGKAPTGRGEYRWLLLLVVSIAGIWTGGCRQGDAKQTRSPTDPISDSAFLALFSGAPDTLPSYLLPYHEDPDFRETFPVDMPPPRLDTTLDLRRFTLEQIRYLRCFVAARHGYLFTDLTLRAFFNRFQWYQPIWIPADFLPKLAPWEQRWQARLQEREDELRASSYVEANGVRRASVAHVVNRWVFDSLPRDLLAHLDTAGFAILAGKHKQLWNVYDLNQYDGIPSLVTPDAFLQVLHMRFKYLLKDLERERFVSDLDASLSQLRGRLRDGVPGPPTSGVEQAEAVIAVAQAFLHGSEADLTTLPSSVADAALHDYRAGLSGTGFGSSTTDETTFDWSRLVPRGHYAASDESSRYFRALKWMGTARWRLGPDHFPAALALAKAWEACGPDGPAGIARIMKAVDALSGPRNGLSPADLVQELKGREASDFFAEPERNKLVLKLQESNPARILVRTGKPVAKAELEEPFLRVFPLRWSGDAEILQRLVDLKKRPFPSGLDIFAVRGIDVARKVLQDELQVQESWPAWADTFQVLRNTRQLTEGSDFHSRRMAHLQTLFKIPEKAPPFQKTPSWQRHVLVTGLAGWTLQKQENILYQEQAEGAECGEGGGPPPPDPLGWIDPNEAFWNGAAEIVRASDSLLRALGLRTRTSSVDSVLLADFALLAEASRLELEGRPLPKRTLDWILWIGGHLEQLTYQITQMQPEEFNQSDENLAAAATDVYSYNAKPLMVATGFADELWALVEIGGYSHLARGAVFSHREWIGTSRLTDKEWHDQLGQDKAPERPEWQRPLFSSAKPPTTVPSTSGLLGASCN